jgi:peptide-methionine (S)-S-oxide reductase
MISANKIQAAFWNTLPVAILLGIAGVLWSAQGPAAASAIPLPDPVVDQQTAGGEPQVAVIAGGCFWGVQAVFQHTRGVLNAVSGYAGGEKSTAEYEVVSSGVTGHAESVQVTYDPKQVSYGQLLQVFFSVVHDPTQFNRQGPDTGTQYRSAVFYSTPQQKDAAEKYIAQLEAAKLFPKRIVTQVSPLKGFYPAEAYHQDYATRHPNTPYIATFDLPKIANLKAAMPRLYREKPVLVSQK